MDIVAEFREVCKWSLKTTECITSAVTLFALFLSHDVCVEMDFSERGKEKQYKSSSFNQ